ncbi:MAG TPA: hypothetical protein VG276_01530 [Actinomycetes bacterium]|nr:hypothetical protein [Actinomycetes bacterium]
MLAAGFVDQDWLGPAGGRLVVAGPLLLTVPRGTQESGVAQLAVVVGLMVVLIAIESRRAIASSATP